MKKLVVILALLPSLLGPASASAQGDPVDGSQTGAWYMYFWGKRLDDSKWGFQGDVQFRNWEVLGDLEQLLLRGGVTFTPASNDVTFTLGYANITSGAFGASDETSGENRMFQQMVLPQQIGSRFRLRHRSRYEQRWVEGQDVRTRFRYALFVDVPLTNEALVPNTTYLAFYNEIFINRERDIGDGRTVEHFDRNRLYGALGYVPWAGIRVQFGYMRQTTNSVTKGQFQLSLHQSF